MANRTDPTAKSVHGTNPQFLVEKLLRNRIYSNTYWKEQCLGLNAETLVDRAMELKNFGGTYGGNRKPTPFMCLVLKMLAMAPEKEIVYEFILNEDYPYVRLLGAFYLRLIGKPVEIYKFLEPLYVDYRKVRKRTVQGTLSTHVDEFIDELLTQEFSCDVVLPRLPKRYHLEQQGLLEKRKSELDHELDVSSEETSEEEISGGNSAHGREREEQSQKDKIKDSGRRRQEHEHRHRDHEKGTSGDRSSNRHRDRSSSRDRHQRRNRYRDRSRSRERRPHRHRYRDRSRSRDRHRPRRRHSRETSDRRRHSKRRRYRSRSSSSSRSPRRSRHQSRSSRRDPHVRETPATKKDRRSHGRYSSASSSSEASPSPQPTKSKETRRKKSKLFKEKGPQADEKTKQDEKDEIAEMNKLRASLGLKPLQE